MDVVGLAIPVPWLLLLAAGVMLYVSSRSAAGALGGMLNPEPRTLNPFMQAVGHWLPIAAVAVLAVVMGRAQVAVGVVLATSVGCLALVMGLAAMQAPIAPGSAEARRAWGFVLPAGVLVLLIGLRVEFSLLHALVLAVQGVVVLLAVQASDQAQSKGSGFGVQGSEPIILNPEPRILNPFLLMAGQALLAMGLAVVGGWLAIDAVVGIGQRTGVPLDVLATGAISALLVLPIIGATAVRGSSLSMSTDERQSTAGDVQVGVALLNLCLLLPLVIVLWTLRHDQPLLFPLRMWRVDAVVLTVLGLLLLPVSLGRWRLDRHEGLALVIAYAAYLMAASWAGTR